MKPPLPQSFAYIMPLSESNTTRILVGGKRVIVKFLPADRISTKFGAGTIVIFYQTKSNRKLVGEGTVVMASMMPPEEAASRYASSLVTTRKELWEYVTRVPGRENKNLLVLELNDVVAYPVPIVWGENLSMVGRFINGDVYSRDISNRLR